MKKIEFKIKGNLRVEQMAIKFLLFISIFSLIATILSEFLLKNIIPSFNYESLHIDFIQNILLGIYGSAIISFMCLVFPYIKKKSDQEKDLLTLLKYIFFDYYNLYSRVIARHDKKVSDYTFFSEICIYEDSKSLIEHINCLEDDYTNLDIRSEEIEKVINEIRNKVLQNTLMINEFAKTIVPVDYYNNPLEIPKTLNKDTNDINAESDLYACLITLLNNNLTMDNFDKIFVHCFDVKEIKKKCTNFNIKNSIKSYNRYIEKDAEVRKILLLSEELFKIKNKHINQYIKQQDDELAKKYEELIKSQPKK